LHGHSRQEASASVKWWRGQPGKGPVDKCVQKSLTGRGEITSAYSEKGKRPDMIAVEKIQASMRKGVEEN